MKQIITSTPVLALFNAGAETVLSADASSYGLGAVLLQKQPQSNFKPITYISRSLMTTEQRYAQLEKESLAFTWACEKFADYLIGLKFHIHTDHKPLIPLFSTKNLEDLPVCIQRYRLRILSKDIQPFRSVAAELSVENELLLKGSRIVAPTELRSEMLDKLHEGHLGITKCHARARQSVWWPGISQHLAEKVKNCVGCTTQIMDLNFLQRRINSLPKLTHSST